MTTAYSRRKKCGKTALSMSLNSKWKNFREEKLLEKSYRSHSKKLSRKKTRKIIFSRKGSESSKVFLEIVVLRIRS